MEKAPINTLLPFSFGPIFVDNDLLFGTNQELYTLSYMKVHSLDDFGDQCCMKAFCSALSLMNK